MTSRVTLDFINRLRDAQIQIYKEDSMNEVESNSVNSEIDLLISLFNNSRINQKEYYLLLNLIISPTYHSDSLSKIKTNNNDNKVTELPISSRSIMEIIHFVTTFQGLEPSKKDKFKIDDQKRFFVDIVTFSIIPSYFSFFWTELSIKNLFKFFNCLKKKVSANLYDSLARIGFCTPFFLHFSQLCFQSVFSELTSTTCNLKNIQKEELIQKIKYNAKMYQHFIPDETFVVLACSTDPLRTLTNAFFNVALSSMISAQAFGFFHFSCRPTKEALLFLKNMFDINQNNSYLLGFLDAIFNCDYRSKNGETKISRYKEIMIKFSEFLNDTSEYNEKVEEQKDLNEFELKISQCSSSSIDNLSEFDKLNFDALTKRKLFHIDSVPKVLFQNDKFSFENIEPVPNKYKLFDLFDIYYSQDILKIKFFSSIDVEFLKFMSGKAPVFNLPEKIEYFCDSKPGLNKFSKVTVDEKTVLSHAYIIAPLIRNLLQRADLIPLFKKEPPNLSLYDFFNRYLVKHGDLENLVDRARNFEHIMIFFPDKSIDQNIIREALASTAFTRMKKIKALSTFSTIEFKLKLLNASSQKQISMTRIVEEINNKFLKQFKPFRYSFEYPKSPKSFIEDYKLAIQKFNESKEPNSIRFPQKVIFAILSEKIDLYSFSIQREKLKKFPISLKEYDEMFNEQSSQRLLSFIKEYFPKTRKQPNQNEYNTQPLQRASSAINFTPRLRTTEFNKNEYIMKKIMRVSVDKSDIVETMIEAFREPSIMRKIDLISFALTNFQLFIESDYPPNKGKLGSDEFTPAFAALIIFCNLPMTVTNYVFLHDMTTGDLPATEIFGGYISTIPIYLSVAIEYVIPEFAKNPPFLLEDDE